MILLTNLKVSVIMNMMKLKIVLQFYTDLNTDGRFLNVGENQWGLRDWYSVDDIEEKVHQQFKN